LNEARNKLSGRTAQEPTNRLIEEYKLKRVNAKMLDEEMKKVRRMEQIISEPSSLSKMPGIPTADDLRRMTESED
jgi:hypothetical protein